MNIITIAAVHQFHAHIAVFH